MVFRFCPGLRLLGFDFFVVVDTDSLVDVSIISVSGVMTIC